MKGLFGGGQAQPVAAPTPTFATPTQSMYAAPGAVATPQEPMQAPLMPGGARTPMGGPHEQHSPPKMSIFEHLASRLPEDSVNPAQLNFLKMFKGGR